MAEQTTKPLDHLRTVAAGVTAEDALVAATKQAMSATLRSYAQWLYHLQELSGLTAAHGLDNMLAVMTQLDPDAASVVQQILTAAQTFHGAVTDDPFPTLHAQPVPPPEPEPEPQP